MIVFAIRQLNTNTNTINKSYFQIKNKQNLNYAIPSKASTLIGSLENLLEGGDALMNEKTVTAEAIKRVQKAQGLIVKFIEESGVKDDKLAAYVSSHK
jgi:hypothetical protein